MGSQWLYRRDDLSGDDKLIASVWDAWQAGGNPTPLEPKQVAKFAGRSIRTVQRCMARLRHYRILREQIVVGRSGEELTLYQIVEPPQLEMFGGTGKRRGLAVRSSVEKYVEKGDYGGGVEAEKSPDMPMSGDSQSPQYLCPNSNTNSKPGAAAPSPPIPCVENPKNRRREALKRVVEHFDRKKSEEDERKIEARKRRLGGIAVATLPPGPRRPMTDSEIERRRRELREQAAELLKRYGSG
jgi:hypothetical protein